MGHPDLSSNPCFAAHSLCDIKKISFLPRVSFIKWILRLPQSIWAVSLVAQQVKNQPAMQETLVQFLSCEVPLEKGLATHTSILGLPWWLRW